MTENKNKDNRIFGIVCKLCGDNLYSMFRHDFKICGCGEVGIDGGQNSYIRVLGSPNNYLWIYKKPETKKERTDK